MRKITCFLLIGCAVVGYGMLAGAAETWRWKDENGVTHYSDRPVPGAERVNVIAPKPNIAVQQRPGPDPAAAPPDVAARAPAVTPYTRCEIVAPTNEETFNAVTSVNVGIQLEPELQEGHRVRVQLDGKIVSAWPTDALSQQLADLERGAHTISAAVFAPDGRNACLAPTITFHVRLPTVPQVRPTQH